MEVPESFVRHTLRDLVRICVRASLSLVLLASAGCAPEQVDGELLKLPDQFDVVRKFETSNRAGGPEFVDSYLVVRPSPGSSVRELIGELRSHYETYGITFERSPSGPGELFGTGRALASIGVLSEYVGENGSIDAETIERETVGLAPSRHVLVTLSP